MVNLGHATIEVAKLIRERPIEKRGFISPVEGTPGNERDMKGMKMKGKASENRTPGYACKRESGGSVVNLIRQKIELLHFSSPAMHLILACFIFHCPFVITKEIQETNPVQLPARPGSPPVTYDNFGIPRFFGPLPQGILDPSNSVQSSTIDESNPATLSDKNRGGETVSPGLDNEKRRDSSNRPAPNFSKNLKRRLNGRNRGKLVITTTARAVQLHAGEDDAAKEEILAHRNDTGMVYSNASDALLAWKSAMRAKLPIGTTGSQTTTSPIGPWIPPLPTSIRSTSQQYESPPSEKAGNLKSPMENATSFADFVNYNSINAELQNGGMFKNNLLNRSTERVLASWTTVTASRTEATVTLPTLQLAFTDVPAITPAPAWPVREATDGPQSAPNRGIEGIKPALLAFRGSERLQTPGIALENEMCSCPCSVVMARRNPTAVLRDDGNEFASANAGIGQRPHVALTVPCVGDNCPANIPEPVEIENNGHSGGLSPNEATNTERYSEKSGVMHPRGKPRDHVIPPAKTSFSPRDHFFGPPLSGPEIPNEPENQDWPNK